MGYGRRSTFQKKRPAQRADLLRCEGGRSIFWGRLDGRPKLVLSLVDEGVQLVAKDVQGRAEGLWIGDAHGLGGEHWRADEGAKGDIPEGDGRREVARLFNDGAVVCVARQKNSETKGL